ncbi:MAG TPA: VWA domain-containing protein, partial [Blastocatellia bacterium]|nr:VWA domain-containing protein [Blastocatellia bacterium]
MTRCSLMAAVISAIGLTAWATYSSRAVSAQERATQPVSVYVAALKGECMPERAVMFVGGQAFVGPPVMGPPNAPNSGKTILTRFAEDSISRRLAEDEFRKNKMFRVVDSPMQADFVFCLCTRYHEFKVPAEMRQHMPEPVRIGTQAGAVSVESYFKTPRDPKALNEAAFWKTDDQGIGPQDEQTGKANEKDKKRKGKKDNRANGPVVMMNGRPVDPLPEVLPHDLVKGFIKLWPALAATVAAQPKPQPAVAGRDETPRPKLPPNDATATVNETPPNAEPANSSTLRIETTLVIVPVMAMDKDGKYLPGLTVTDFQIYEDNVKQEISDFGSAETPINVALILDVSGSTRFKLDDIQDAALVFVDQLRPQDRVMVVSFDQQVRVEAEFTNVRDKLMRAILRTRTGGGTRVQDALDLTLTERLNKIQGRKAIVAFTDGVDNLSWMATWKDVTARVEESGVIVYPVRYDTMTDVTSVLKAALPPNVKIPGNGKEEYDRAAQRLKNLAAVSGGRYYEVETIGDTKQAFAN